MLFPYVFGKIVDSLFYHQNKSRFLFLLGVYGLVFLSNQILHFGLDFSAARIQTEFAFDIKKYIFQKVLTYKGKELADLKSGSILYSMNQGTNEVIDFIYADIFYGISAALDFVLCMIMMSLINVWLAVVVFILAVFTFFLGKYFSVRTKRLQKKYIKYLTENESWLLEFLNCMRDTRLLSAVRNVTNRYLEKDISAVRFGIVQSKYETVSERANSGLKVLSILCLYCVSAFFIVGGSLTLGGMVACMDYFQRIALMLERISLRFLTIPKRLVAIERIMAIGDVSCEDYDEQIPPHKIQKNDVYFKNVQFSYKTGERILNDISLHIKPGEKMALVGGSGAGKSTLVGLLCRFYDVDAGEILIDGYNIKRYNVCDLRGQIGVVHQESILFQNTIRYNLIFSNSMERDDEIWSVLESIKLAEFVRDLPEGLDTVLGGQERALSGGQKQRIAIGRLYLKKASIIIFDESTSALDRETEEEIIGAWDKLLGGCTLVIIAHRLATILNADRVACLSDGRVVGCATHKELLRTCEEYRRLFKDQYEGAI